ncbi:hypothetical protein ACQJBY_070518 [Aegilops geniculata]
MDNPCCTPPAISSHLSVGLVLLRLDPSAAPPDPRRSSRIRSLLPRLPSGETPHASQPSTPLLWAFSPSLSLSLSLSNICFLQGRKWPWNTTRSIPVLAAGNLSVDIKLLRFDLSVRPAAASCIPCRLEEDNRE